MYVEELENGAGLKHPEMTGLFDVQGCLRESA